MSDFNPAAYISPDVNELGWAEQRRLTNDATNRSISEGYATHESNRRYVQESATKADDEQRRRMEADRNYEINAGQYGIQQSQLAIQQSQEERAAMKAEHDRRSQLSQLLTKAFSEADSADEIEALSQQFGYSEGVAFRPGPAAAGTQSKPGELPSAVAPPQEGETIGGAATRIANGSEAIAVHSPMAGDVPTDVLAGDLGPLSVTGDKGPAVEDAVKYTPEQVEAARKDFTDSKHTPFGEVEAQASAEQQRATAESFTKRVKTIQSLRLPPAEEQLAIGAAAEVHGIPMPPPQPAAPTPGMPPPPPGMEQQPQQMNPQVAALAMAPPEVPVSVTDMGRQHGGLEAYDLKTGEKIFDVDWLGVKQARRDRMRERWNPLLESITNPEDRKKATGAMQTYIDTGDPAAKEILHWLFQKDAAALKQGIDPKEEATLDLSRARYELAKGNQNIRVTDLAHKAARTAAATFNKNNDVVGFNKGMEGLNKADGLIDSPNGNDSLSGRLQAAEIITARFGKAASNAEREFVMNSGLQAKIGEAVNWLNGGGELSKQQIDAIHALNKTLQGYARVRQEKLAQNLHDDVFNSAEVRDYGSKLGWDDKKYDEVAKNHVKLMLRGNSEPDEGPGMEIPDLDEDEDL